MTINNGLSSIRGQVAALLLFIACLACSANALAQSDNTDNQDTEPPIIELEELAEVVADSSQVFTVQVAEDGELQDVTLFYRRIGQQPYNSTDMQQLASSEFYSATIVTDAEDLRPIEYYIQARDLSGNRTVKGFAFDPFIRSLAPAAVPVTPAQPSVTAPAPLETEPEPARVAIQTPESRPPIPEALVSGHPGRNSRRPDRKLTGQWRW